MSLPLLALVLVGNAFGAAPPLAVTSPAFEHEGAIPEKYTCQGEKVSPPLSWSGAPEETQSFALVVHDPDAPIGIDFVHWVVWNLPADATGIPEDFSLEDHPHQGKNGAAQRGWIAHCPPRGSAHRYFFEVYALDTELELKRRAKRKHLERAMLGHVLGQGALVGIVDRRRKRE
jgi:Raf kinase inhibitor-like YbhB/YbcL family protein